MLFTSWLRSTCPAARSAVGRRRSATRLTVEALEDRCVPTGGLSAALVADIVPGAGSSAPYSLTNVQGTLYFGTTDPTTGPGIYKSDGTAAGTVLVKAVSPNDYTVKLSSFTAMNGSVFFTTSNNGLWKTDGTTAGTAVVKGIAAHGLTPVNGKFFFEGDDGINGLELWVSDGTTAGTVLVKDIYAGSTTVNGSGDNGGHDHSKFPNSSGPGELTNVNGTLLFAATDGKNGSELWRSDGTAAGTTLVKDILKGSAGSDPHNLTVMNGVLYFAAAGGLWRSDGTSAGTVQVKNVGTITEVASVGGTLFLAAGGELWESDGSAAGTVLVKDIAPGPAGSAPQNLTNVNGVLFFSADDGTSGRELWKSDGTAAGTFRVNDINPGAGSATPDSLTNVNGLLYFTAENGANGTELWQSDGTAPGTSLVRDIYPGASGSDPAFLVSMNNKLYFAATDPDHGRELWDPPPVSDGGYLLVSDYDGNSVLRYDEHTGAFIDTFVSKHSAGLTEPQALVFGPHDHDLYVGSGHFGGSYSTDPGPGQLRAVLRYDGDTGAPVGDGVFSESGQLHSTHAVIFGPDGNLYVGDWFGPGSMAGRVLRYNGMTGAFIDEFIPARSGGLRHPFSMVFGPTGRDDGKLDLYVTYGDDNSVLRYDGTTGAFIGVFVHGNGSSGPTLDFPAGMTFGPDGNLYVASTGFTGGLAAVVRYQGPAGPAPGAFMDLFVPPGRGSLLAPNAVLFGPDGNSDGHQDLYVASVEFTGKGSDRAKNGSIKRYDGVSGYFIDTFISDRSGRLDNPTALTFTETDPVTLAYTGETRFSAIRLSATSTTAANAGIQVTGGGQAVLTDAAGKAFPLSFSLVGVLQGNGTAGGNVNFVFGPAFAQVWGAVPGVDSIHLTGRITAITVAEDGAITLEGRLTGKDLARGGGVAFVEENVPFKIEVSPDLLHFTLQWCELPTFEVQLANGELTVH